MIMVRGEFDFHQIKVRIDDKNRIYHQATITLPKSGIVFGKLYTNETFNSVNDSMIKFFQLYRWRPRRNGI